MVLSMSQDEKGPITDICVVADKSKCPQNYEVIAKAYDDPTLEADVWKDGFFAFSRVLRYICFSREVPKNAYVCNVVADIAITNAGDIVPSGFTPIDFCADVREKALRKKQICVRTMPRESAVDAVSDVILLAKLKKPPTGYSLAGDIDGLQLCYKYGTIPANFPGTKFEGPASVYPNLPYPIHPLSHSSALGHQAGTPTNEQAQPSRPGHSQGATPQAAGYSSLDRQYSAAGVKLGIEGVPFELSHLLSGNDNQRRDLPYLKPTSTERLEMEFNYDFDVEQTVLYN